MYKYPELFQGKLVRRYKRFFVDIETPEGLITAHNANTGSMKSLLNAENPVLYSKSDDPKRKLKYTLELISVGGEWIVSNTIKVNRLVECALLDGELPDIYSGGKLCREYSFQDSKFDFMADNGRQKTVIEVKSVTYFDDKCNYFPDAVTTRGQKHLKTLSEAVKAGYRAISLYVCMADRPSFACATHIDPDYCKALALAEFAGVEVVTVRNIFDFESRNSTISVIAR